MSNAFGIIMASLTGRLFAGFSSESDASAKLTITIFLILRWLLNLLIFSGIKYSALKRPDMADSKISSKFKH